MTVRISLAQAEDIPALCVLLVILFSQEVEFTPNVEAHQRGLTRIIADPDIGSILVARHQDRVVGMVNLLYTVSTALGECVALLEDMVVAPQARAGGVGSELLDHAVNFARAHGCKRITLLTDADNDAALRFYRLHGFKGSPMLPLRLPLDD